MSFTALILSAYVKNGSYKVTQTKNYFKNFIEICTKENINWFFEKGVRDYKMFMWGENIREH